MPSDSFVGNWEGHWRSQHNGHAGKLRCIVQPTGQQPGEYAFRYEATWQKFLTGYFTIHCQSVSQGPGRWRVSGEKDLGAVLGGRFSHTADLTTQTIRARYSARLDQGEMVMERPANAGGISTKSATPAR